VIGTTPTLLFFADTDEIRIDHRLGRPMNQPGQIKMYRGAQKCRCPRISRSGAPPLHLYQWRLQAANSPLPWDPSGIDAVVVFASIALGADPSAENPASIILRSEYNTVFG